MSSFYIWPLSYLSGSSEAPSPVVQSEDPSISVDPSLEPERTGSSSSAELSYLVALEKLRKQWFVDSGRPEKGQKYVLSLHRSLSSFRASGFDLQGLEKKLQEFFASGEELIDLQQKARGWKDYYLGNVLEYFWSTGLKSFDLFAFCALKALDSADSYSNVRLQYSDFLENLRAAFSTEEYIQQKDQLDPKLVHLLEDLCYDKFTDTHLFNYWDAFLEQLVGNVEGTLNFETLSRTLEEKNEKLHHTDPDLRKEAFILNYEKLQGTLGASFDPVGRSNVPKKRSEQTVLGREGNYWKMGRIAHGTPTIEYNLITKAWYWTTGAYNAEIIPEYKAFLSAAQRQGERVFYVNLQQRKGLERDRSDQIESLQKDPKFRHTFYSMALPMDGSTFTNLIKNDVSTSSFKENILNLFFDKDGKALNDLSSAKLPFDLLERMDSKPELAEQIIEEFRKIIEKVHLLYFDEKELASPTDRQDFLMQFYSDLTDYLISRHYVVLDSGKELEANERIRWVVQACKDNKDRGGAKNGIDEAKYVLLTYPLDQPEALHQALYDIYVNTLGAYTIKFEEILPNRLVYFTSLLKRYALLATDPEKIRRIRENQPAYFQIKNHQSARIFDSQPRSSIPTPQTALSEKERQILLDRKNLDPEID